MRSLWIPLILATLLFAQKDNFIFDVSPQSATQSTSGLEALEVKIDHLSRQGNLHNTRLGALDKSLKALQSQMAALHTSVARQGSIDHSVDTHRPQKGEDQTLLEQLSIEVAQLRDRVNTPKRQVAQGETDSARPIVSPPTTATDESRLRTIEERLILLERKVREQSGSPVALSGGIVPLEPFFIDSFVFLTITLIALLFIMLLAALSRSQKAEEKISRLAEFYQSSTKNTEESK